jgi:hypothetical protein
MAIKKTIEIDVNANAAEKDINDLNKSVVRLENSVEDFAKTGKKSLDNIDKNVKETEKSTKSLSEGFKATGVALKAMGIGLVISLMTTLKEIFTSNQKVADLFSVVLGTVSNVFSQITNVVVSVVEKVGSATKGFEGLTAVVGGLLKLGLTPLKAAFFGIKLVIDEVRLAFEESIFGDKDAKTIKKLTERIDETKASLKKVGTDAVEAGKQVGNNIGKAISEVGAVVEGTIDGVSKISVASAIEQSKANINLQNTAKLAEATQAGLVEQYDRQAEKLRQVRDEERNTIADRIKANNDLKGVLNSQESAMLGTANAQIAAAKATLAQNNNIENQTALINANTNRQGVLAQIEGLRSEQKANDLALDKELKDLAKTKLETETELAINQKKFTAERITDTQLKLEAQKKAAADELVIEQKRLDDAKLIYKEGTQARVDAEKDFALKKQEIEQQIILADDAIAEEKRNKTIENNQKIIDSETASFEAKREALRIQEETLLADKALSEEQRGVIEKKYSDDRKKLKDEEIEKENTLFNAKLDFAKQGLSLIEEVAGKGSKIGKAAAIGQTVISGIQGVQNAYTTAQKSPLTAIFPAYPIVQAGLAGVFSALQIAKMKSAPASGGSGSGGGSVGGGGGGSIPSMPAAPQFNVVGNSGVNQLANTLGGQQPIQAFVVANQVTSQQALDRNIISNASIG